MDVLTAIVPMARVIDQRLRVANERPVVRKLCGSL
jgi:hypothetical protein